MKCPVCLEEIKAKLVETHTDPIEKEEYRIYLCPVCEVQFSDPMKGASPEYQVKVDPYRKSIYTKKLDWRHKTFFEDNMPGQGKVLDIGCGCGNFLLAAQKRGYLVAGVDFDERMIEMGKKWKIRDLYATNFEEYYKVHKQKFDIITLFDVLEHIRNPNIFIDQIKELLYPDGYIVITVPNNGRHVFTKRESYDYPPRHLTRWTKTSLINFLRSKGLNIVTCKTLPISPANIFTNFYSYYGPKVVSFIKSAVFGNVVRESEYLPLDTLLKRQEELPLKGLRQITMQLFPKSNVRQKIISFLTKFAYLITLPLTAATSFYWNYKKIKHPEIGQTIYILARKTNENSH